MAELDEIDVQILKVLLKDGRRSFREVSRLTHVSTPTVQARLRRMMDAGLIQKISPILDPSKFDQGLVCMLYLRVNPSEIAKTGKELAKREEVRSIYLTTGEENLVLRVVVNSLNDLQQLTETLDRDFGVKQHASQMVVRVFKDDPTVLVRPGMAVHLQCETCGGQIVGKPFVLRIGGVERYFCCKTCIDKFRSKYEVKLKGLSITIDQPE